MHTTRRAVFQAGAGIVGGALIGSAPAFADSASQINTNASAALRSLYAAEPKARMLGDRARGILVFPKIVKGGFIFGGMTGDGVLWVGGRTAGYYNISAASFGLQIGAQAFSYALFFITESSLNYLRKSDGWAIGSGPSVVVVDKGVATSITSTTLTQDVYAFPFGQVGLMAGIGIEGSKITRIHPS